MSEYIECPYCHRMTPADELNCIHCGEVLPARVGMLSTLRYPFRSCLFFLILLLVLMIVLTMIFWNLWTN